MNRTNILDLEGWALFHDNCARNPKCGFGRCATEEECRVAFAAGAAWEREQCATIADAVEKDAQASQGPWQSHEDACVSGQVEQAAEDIAHKIRARGRNE